MPKDYFHNNAGMAELADAQDLGSCAARRAGSIPVARTIVFKTSRK
jgi:hypothetical protein